jgi:hypothetical protein
LCLAQSVATQDTTAADASKPASAVALEMIVIVEKVITKIHSCLSVRIGSMRGAAEADLLVLRS